MRALLFSWALGASLSCGLLFWQYMGARDALNAARLAVTTAEQARVADGADASAAQADCAREVAASLRAGQAISRMSQTTWPPPSGSTVSIAPGASRPMFNATDLSDVAGP